MECTVRPYLRSPQSPTVRLSRRPSSVFSVRRSVSVWVGWRCPPSPALITGQFAESAAALTQPAAGSAGHRGLVFLDSHIAVMDVLGNPVSHFIGNVPDGTVPVLPVHERHPDTAGIDAATAAHHGHVVLGFRHLGQIVLQLGGHRIGALNTGIGGKLDLHIETAFIGAGHVLPADDAQRHHGRKEGQRQGCACKELLFMMKAPVERLFVEILHAFFHPVHRPPELSVRYVKAFLEESGGQHRCEGKRNEKGKKRCKNDGQSELAEELEGLIFAALKEQE